MAHAEKHFLSFLILLFLTFSHFHISQLSAQTHPYDFPLNIAWSTDGVTFQPPTTFQDSSGVPHVIRWKGDTLIATFQWFRVPQPGPTWDRIAIKFSYDAGQTWTQPTPANFLNYPGNFIRPFDPTLLKLHDGSLRMYFSTKPGVMQTLDSLVDTYAANSTDGINYTFDTVPVFGHPTKPVIDPSLIQFNGKIHFAAPAGAPQDGAYHATSDTTDGIFFTSQAGYPSDNNHQWTGNYCYVSPDTLRFYGQTKLVPGNKKIWFKESSDGNTFGATYTPTNLDGGDNSVLRISNNSYLIVYVGEAYLVGLDDNADLPLKDAATVRLYPNPTTHTLHIQSIAKLNRYTLHDNQGRIIQEGELTQPNEIQLNAHPAGVYLLAIETEKGTIFKKLVIRNK